MLKLPAIYAENYRDWVPEMLDACLGTLKLAARRCLPGARPADPLAPSRLRRDGLAELAAGEELPPAYEDLAAQQGAPGHVLLAAMQPQPDEPAAVTRARDERYAVSRGQLLPGARPRKLRARRSYCPRKVAALYA